jgi:hypothetical protein
MKLRDMVVVFHTTFNNISLISWRKPEYTEKTTDLPQETPYTYNVYSKLIIVSLSFLPMALCATKYLNDGSRLYNLS